MTAQSLMTRLPWKILLTALLMCSLTVQSAVDRQNQFASSDLSRVKAFAVNVDPPHGVLYSELSNLGLSRENLEDRITQRLRDAGIPVISFAEALEQDNTGLLNLRFRVVVPDTTFYSYDLSLSVKQKAPLADNSGFYSVGTWSDGNRGALEFSRLGNINTYTLKLVDNFINAYRGQP